MTTLSHPTDPRVLLIDALDAAELASQIPWGTSSPASEKSGSPSRSPPFAFPGSDSSESGRGRTPERDRDDDMEFVSETLREAWKRSPSPPKVQIPQQGQRRASTGNARPLSESDVEIQRAWERMADGSAGALAAESGAGGQAAIDASKLRFARAKPLSLEMAIAKQRLDSRAHMHQWGVREALPVYPSSQAPESSSATTLVTSKSTSSLKSAPPKSPSPEPSNGSIGSLGSAGSSGSMGSTATLGSGGVGSGYRISLELAAPEEEYKSPLLRVGEVGTREAVQRLSIGEREGSQLPERVPLSPVRGSIADTDSRDGEANLARSPSLSTSTVTPGNSPPPGRRPRMKRSASRPFSTPSTTSTTTDCNDISVAPATTTKRKTSANTSRPAAIPGSRSPSRGRRVSGGADTLGVWSSWETARRMSRSSSAGSVGDQERGIDGKGSQQALDRPVTMEKIVKDLTEELQTTKSNLNAALARESALDLEVRALRLQNAQLSSALQALISEKENVLVTREEHRARAEDAEMNAAIAKRGREEAERELRAARDAVWETGQKVKDRDRELAELKEQLKAAHKHAPSQAQHAVHPSDDTRPPRERGRTEPAPASPVRRQNSSPAKPSTTSTTQSIVASYFRQPSPVTPSPPALSPDPAPLPPRKDQSRAPPPIITDRRKLTAMALGGFFPVSLPTRIQSVPKTAPAPTRQIPEVRVISATPLASGAPSVGMDVDEEATDSAFEVDSGDERPLAGDGNEDEEEDEVIVPGEEDSVAETPPRFERGEDVTRGAIKDPYLDLIADPSFASDSIHSSSYRSDAARRRPKGPRAGGFTSRPLPSSLARVASRTGSLRRTNSGLRKVSGDTGRSRTSTAERIQGGGMVPRPPPGAKPDARGRPPRPGSVRRIGSVSLAADLDMGAEIAATPPKAPSPRPPRRLLSTVRKHFPFRKPSPVLPRKRTTTAPLLEVPQPSQGAFDDLLDDDGYVDSPTRDAMPRSATSATIAKLWERATRGRKSRPTTRPPSRQQSRPASRAHSPSPSGHDDPIGIAVLSARERRTRSRTAAENVKAALSAVAAAVGRTGGTPESAQSPLARAWGRARGRTEI